MRRPRYRRLGEAPGHVTHREVRDLWYHLARLREARGDAEGARRARRSALILGDPRPSGAKR